MVQAHCAGESSVSECSDKDEEEADDCALVSEEEEASLAEETVEAMVSVS